MRLSLLLPKAPDRWAAVSARGYVVEGIAKRAIRSVSRSCCGGGEGMRGGGLEWLNYFRTKLNPISSKSPFTCTLDSKTLKGWRESYFVLF